MKKITIISFCLLCGNMVFGQAGTKGDTKKKEAVPLATIQSPAQITRVGDNNGLATDGNVTALPVAGAQRAIPVANPAANHTIQMPVQGKDAPKRIRPVKQGDLK